MTPTAIRGARRTLGFAWGFGRPLHAAELARALRLRGQDVGHTVLKWERGKLTPSGPVTVAIEMMLAGAMPPDGIDAIRTVHGRPRTDGMRRSELER